MSDMETHTHTLLESVISTALAGLKLEGTDPVSRG